MKTRSKKKSYTSSIEKSKKKGRNSTSEREQTNNILGAHEFAQL